MAPAQVKDVPADPPKIDTFFVYPTTVGLPVVRWTRESGQTHHPEPQTFFSGNDLLVALLVNEIAKSSRF